MMSAEVPFELAGELDAFPKPRFISPVEMIAHQQSARRVFDVFRELYTGDPPQFADTKKTVREKDDDGNDTQAEYIIQHGPFILERLGFDYPAISRRRGGQENIEYPGVLVTGFTDLGKMVHVRHAAVADHGHDSYFVAVGNLATGMVEEPRVIDVRHRQDAHHRPHTTLFLEGGEQDWPREYQPQIAFTPNSVSYYPGGDRRTESIRGIEQLYPRTMGRKALGGATLHAVQ